MSWSQASSTRLNIENASSFQKVLYNHNNLNHNSNTRKDKAQADSVVQVRTVLLTSDFGSSTGGERHNSYYANHTIWPHKRAAHPVMFKIGRDPKTLTTSSMVKIQLSTSNSMAETQLSARVVQCQPSTAAFFQNPQILRSISSGHDVINTPAPFPVWCLLWQWWLSYPFRTGVKLYPMAIHLNS